MVFDFTSLHQQDLENPKEGADQQPLVEEAPDEQPFILAGEAPAGFDSAV